MFLSSTANHKIKYISIAKSHYTLSHCNTQMLIHHNNKQSTEFYPDYHNYIHQNHCMIVPLYIGSFQQLMLVINYIGCILILKGFKRDLNKAAKLDETGIVKKWVTPMVNHVYWCAASTPDGNSDVMEAKYLSMLNHIVNKHKHNNAHYPECCHGRLKRYGTKKPLYLKKGLFLRKFF